MKKSTNPKMQALIAKALEPLEGETIAAESSENSYLVKESQVLNDWAEQYLVPVIKDEGFSKTSIYCKEQPNKFSQKFITFLEEVFTPYQTFPNTMTYSSFGTALNHEFELQHHYGVLQVLRNTVAGLLSTLSTNPKPDSSQAHTGIDKFEQAWKTFILDWRYKHEHYNTFTFKTVYSSHLKREVDLAVKAGKMEEPTSTVWLVTLTAVLAFDLEGHSGSSAGMGTSYIKGIIEQTRYVMANSKDCWDVSLLYRTEQSLRSPDSAFEPVFAALEHNTDKLLLGDLDIIAKLIVCATTFGLLSPLTLDLETEFNEVGTHTIRKTNQQLVMYQNNRKSDVFLDVIDGVRQSAHYNNAIVFSDNGGLNWYSRLGSKVFLEGDLLNDEQYMTEFPTLRVLLDPIAMQVEALNHPLSWYENLAKFSCDDAPLKGNNKTLKPEDRILDKYGRLLTITGAIEDQGAIVGYNAVNRKGEKLCILQSDWETGVGEFNGFKYPLFRQYVDFYTEDYMDDRRNELHEWVDTIEAMPMHHAVDLRGYEIPDGVTRLFIGDVLYIAPDNAPIRSRDMGINGIKIDFGAIPELLNDWQTIDEWRNISGDNVFRLPKGAGNPEPRGNGGW